MAKRMHARALELFATAREQYGWDAIDFDGEWLRVKNEPANAPPDAPSVAASERDGEQLALFRLGLVIRPALPGERAAHNAGIHDGSVRSPSTIEERFFEAARSRFRHYDEELLREQIRQTIPDVVLFDDGQFQFCGVAIDATDLDFGVDRVERILDEADLTSQPESNWLKIVADVPDEPVEYELFYKPKHARTKP